MELHLSTACLHPTSPFDFTQALKFLGLFTPTQHEHRLTPQTLTKALILNEKPIGFQLQNIGTVEAPKLDCQIFSDTDIDLTTKTKVLERIAFFLSLTDDLQPFYEIGQQDPDFVPIIKQLYGYHQVKFLTPFESACWAVLTQRNPMSVARNIKQGLIENFGGFISINGISYPAFPEPEKIAAIAPSQLAVVVKNQRKAEYLSAVAKAFTDSSESFLRTGNYGEVENWLRKIKGIGNWSANFILIRGLGRVESAILTEKKLLDAIAKFYTQEKPITQVVVQQIAKRYGQWQGYWAHYLRVVA